MLGSRPVFWRSNKGNDYEENEYDEGGHSIVNGTEKVIVCQERLPRIKYMYLKIQVTK